MGVYLLVSLTLFLSKLYSQDEVKIPFVGDETSINSIEASPTDFIGESFVICGLVSIGSRYSSGYRSADLSHYSLYFSPIGTDNRRKGGNVFLFLDRKLGKKAVDRLIEKIESEGEDSTRVRITATISEERYSRNAWEFLEILDIQFPKDDWSGWEEGMIEWPKMPKPEFRVWTDSEGDKVTAKFSDFQESLDLLHLETESGKTVKINLKFLSEGDTKYLFEFLALKKLSAIKP